MLFRNNLDHTDLQLASRHECKTSRGTGPGLVGLWASAHQSAWTGSIESGLALNPDRGTTLLGISQGVGSLPGYQPSPDHAALERGCLCSGKEEKQVLEQLGLICFQSCLSRVPPSSSPSTPRKPSLIALAFVSLLAHPQSCPPRGLFLLLVNV